MRSSSCFSSSSSTRFRSSPAAGSRRGTAATAWSVIASASIDMTVGHERREYQHAGHHRIHRAGPHGQAHGQQPAQARLPARRAQPQPGAGRRARRRRRHARRRRRPTSRGRPRGSSRCCPTRRTWSRCSRGRTASSARSSRARSSSTEQHRPGGGAAARRAARARGATMLDAPVSGGEIGAIDATLSIMVGGDAAAFATVQADPRRDGQPRAHHPDRRVRAPARSARCATRW